MYQEGDKQHKRGGGNQRKLRNYGMNLECKILLSAVYSPLDYSQEQKAVNVIRNIYPNASSFTESHLVSQFR